MIQRRHTPEAWTITAPLWANAAARFFSRPRPMTALETAHFGSWRKALSDCAPTTLISGSFTTCAPPPICRRSSAAKVRLKHSSRHEKKAASGFSGSTGHHDPAILLEAMRRFDFDTVLVALNGADVHRLSFAQTVLPEAARRGMGVIGMKVYAAGVLLRGGSSSLIRRRRWVMS